jgi:hypothetical protein
MLTVTAPDAVSEIVEESVIVFEAVVSTVLNTVAALLRSTIIQPSGGRPSV